MEASSEQQAEYSIEMQTLLLHYINNKDIKLDTIWGPYIICGKTVLLTNLYTKYTDTLPVQMNILFVMSNCHIIT